MILDYHKDSSTISGYFKKRSPNSEQGPSNISQSFNRQSSTSEQDLSNISQNFHRSSTLEQDLSNISQNFNRTSNLEEEVNIAAKEHIDDIKVKSEHSTGAAAGAGTGAAAVKPLTSSKYHKARNWKPKPFTHLSKLKSTTKK